MQLRIPFKKMFAMLLTILTMLSAGEPCSAAAASPPNESTEQLPNLFFSRPVVIIDAGHGGIDGGTSHKEVLEKDINLKIAQKLYLFLRSSGYAAILNRNGDYALSEENRWLKSSRHRRDLAQRKSLTDELPTTLLVSLHVNWSRHSGKNGPVVLYQNVAESFLLADSIQQYLNSFYHSSRLPMYGKPFYLLNQINQPAVIVETGFISNERDRKLLCDPAAQKRIASAIADGIMAHLTAW
ncbi:N-acetylmuramoyl-L-alanine amidase [Paenibacillus enshidis]|uniref:N-acetylmuramoyl-L-alanine amidase n=1 Tax=Paenibacillus enshidis TaxID=1458439 RepID=A0ABV5AQE5_9BACL